MAAKGQKILLDQAIEEVCKELGVERQELEQSQTLTDPAWQVEQCKSGVKDYYRKTYQQARPRDARGRFVKQTVALQGQPQQRPVPQPQQQPPVGSQQGIRKQQEENPRNRGQVSDDQVLQDQLSVLLEMNF
jgi:hypothetical protein